MIEVPSQNHVHSEIADKGHHGVETTRHGIGNAKDNGALLSDCKVTPAELSPLHPLNRLGVKMSARHFNQSTESDRECEGWHALKEETSDSYA